MKANLDSSITGRKEVTEAIKKTQFLGKILHFTFTGPLPLVFTDTLSLSSEAIPIKVRILVKMSKT